MSAWPAPTVLGEQIVAVAILPLARARICAAIECDTIFDLTYRTCPVCGSDHWLPLATWLDARKVARANAAGPTA